MSKKDYIIHFLLNDGWKRDNRCKKYETYKKVIDENAFALAFHTHSIVYKTSTIREGKLVGWNVLHQIHMSDINDNSVPSFLLTEEEMEDQDYFDRLGI